MLHWRILVSTKKTILKLGSYLAAYPACWHALRVFVLVHVLAVLLTFLALLFRVANFSTTTLHRAALVAAWNRWDTGQFTDIAAWGYQGAWQTAFFPLYPLLEASIAQLMHISAFAAGLLIANSADFIVLIVLYKLVQRDAEKSDAENVLLAVSCYPTAFFLLAAYNESLFLLFVLLYFWFYADHTWYAALFGFLAALTRSAGLILCIVALYQTWRERRLSPALFTVPLATALYALYCYVRFGDPLAFSHAQSVWQRQLSWPWQGTYNAWLATASGGLLRFDGLHNIIEISAVLFVCAMVVLMHTYAVPIPPQYTVYSTALLLLLLCFPSTDRYPLQSFSRLSLEVFPLFFLLGRAKRPYVLVGTCMLYAFFLLQFLTGRWMT